MVFFFGFQIRGVEVGIVVLVLMVWAGAIALFFNRWGKIRMLLPYQPDYKEQLKVPGTGVCTAPNATFTQHPAQHPCSQVKVYFQYTKSNSFSAYARCNSQRQKISDTFFLFYFNLFRILLITILHCDF